eukprot:m51a1_g10294 hypothetical protein (107) ;mRNA; f:43771-44208
MPYPRDLSQDECDVLGIPFPSPAYKVEGPADQSYNCIAYALGFTDCPAATIDKWGTPAKAFKHMSRVHGSRGLPTSKCGPWLLVSHPRPGPLAHAKYGDVNASYTL